jgi:uncharacterized protein (TIGR02246 family)
VLVSIVAVGCSAPAQPANTPEDKAAIDKLRSDFVAAFSAGDAEGIGKLYTEDAIAFPGNQPTATGRTSIVQFNKGTFDSMTMPKIEVTPQETLLRGDWAIDRGTFVFSATPKAGGPAITAPGRYLILLQKQSDGSWKIIRDMDNSDMPPPPPPPAAAQK